MENANLQNTVSQKHYVKKALSILLSLIMLFSITAGIDLSAYAAVSGNYEYEIQEDGTIMITEYLAWEKSVVLPSKIDAYEVTAIGHGAFSGCESLESITIPDSVTNIGNSAFENCISLTNMVIPNGVTSIGDYTFYDCENLTSITIPNSVTSIGENAFFNCTSLTSITIPDSVTCIGRMTFSLCTSLTNITIPNGVTNIGEYAFERCTSLTSVTIPNSVIGIGNYAFYYCENLTNITIPNSVINLEGSAFCGCDSLANISVASDNKNYVSVDGVLYNKDKSELIKYLSSKTNTFFSIPNSVTSIGDCAFYDCRNLTSITIPNSVTSIGYEAFCCCENLANITMSNNITAIGEYAFSDTAYYNNPNNWNEGVLYLNNYLLKAFTEDVLVPTVQNGTTVIADYAFSGCENLISITIPNSVTSIGENAFSYCKSLKSITIPESVTSINDMTFYNCKNLKGITIPNNVTSIGENAFSNCTSLTGITVPNSLTSIGKSAFSNCESLKSIIIPNSVISIGEQAFYNCENLISVTFPYSVTSINDWTFYHCTRLENFTIPNSVTSIGGYAFYDCRNLVSITIPNSVKYIGNEAFTCEYNYSYYPEDITIMNPNLNIEGCIVSYKTKIYGYCNSTAVAYANSYGNNFYALDDNHVWDDVWIQNEATCLENGTKRYTCTSCKAIKKEVIPATGHKTVMDKAVAATCTKAGKTAGSHCSVCNAVITAQKTVAATGHTYDAGIVTKAATCTATGVKTYTCTSCGATKTETIKATGHSYKTTVTKATTSKNGSSVTKCTKCGTVSKNTAIAYPKTVTLSATSYTYDGKAKKPTVTVKDNAGKTIAASNYTVAYSNNTNVGTATVKVTFKGNYSGSFSKTFKINPKNTSISSVSALYKGFTVKYAKQATQTTGYQVQYSTSSNFSNAKTVTVNKNSTVVKNVTGLTAKKKYYVRIRTYKTVGKTNYYSAWSGAKNVTTSSYPTSISLSSTSYTYDGKVKKPSVTVKHGSTKIASKYYTVSYSGGRKNVGTYTVTIKFKKPYSGTVKKTFKINPKNTSISGLTAQSKAFTVKLKKYTTQTTGYQIQYSTSSNFSNAKTVTIKNTTTSKKVTGLTGNKKYYVRIRTYKTVGKTNYYSGWSKAKTVTTKK